MGVLAQNCYRLICSLATTNINLILAPIFNFLDRKAWKPTCFTQQVLLTVSMYSPIRNGDLLCLQLLKHVSTGLIAARQLLRQLTTSCDSLHTMRRRTKTSSLRLIPGLLRSVTFVFGLPTDTGMIITHHNVDSRWLCEQDAIGSWCLAGCCRDVVD